MGLYSEGGLSLRKNYFKLERILGEHRRTFGSKDVYKAQASEETNSKEQGKFWVGSLSWTQGFGRGYRGRAALPDWYMRTME